MVDCFGHNGSPELIDVPTVHVSGRAQRLVFGEEGLIVNLGTGQAIYHGAARVHSAVC